MKNIKLLLVAALVFGICAYGIALAYEPGEDNPGTEVTISASTETVPCEGDTVTLTITEQNMGNIELEDVYVELYANSTLIETLLGSTANESVLNDDILNADTGGGPGEIFTWQTYVLVNVDTTFTAIGHGFIYDGADTYDVTYPGEAQGTDIEISDEREVDEVTVVTEPCDGEGGCTPGFWKNNADKQGASAWDGYNPSEWFDTVFGVDVTLRGKGRTTYENPTLLQALDANGGGINALARHAVAALLNISNPDIDYVGGMSEAGLIAAVQAAIVAGEYAIQGLADELDYYNNAGCSVNQDGEVVIED